LFAQVAATHRPPTEQAPDVQSEPIAQAVPSMQEWSVAHWVTGSTHDAAPLASTAQAFIAVAQFWTKDQV
jgi:hypothetical protein